MDAGSNQEIGYPDRNGAGGTAPPTAQLDSRTAAAVPFGMLVHDSIGVLIVAPRECNHAGDLLDLAAAAGVSQIWIPARISHSLGLPHELPADVEARAGIPHPFIDDAAATHDLRPAGLAAWIYGWSRSDRDHAVDLVFAAYDESPFAEIEDPDRLLAELAAFNDATGIRYRRSPGATGTALLRSLHRGPRAIKLAPPPPWPMPATKPAQETDFGWWRSLRGYYEHGQELVTAFDVNGMYLAACSSVACGVGDNVHETAPIVVDGSPGYYRAQIRTPTPPAFVDPFDYGTLNGDGSRWFSAPTIALAVELGADVEIVEAFRWPSSHRYLTSWYERIRDARLVLDGAALAALKALYRITIGWLGGSFHDDADELYRPLWRHSIMATARANLYRRVRAIGLATGRYPFAVDVDCLYYAGDVPEGLPISPQLGKFKRAGTAPIGDVAEILATGDRSVLKRLREVTA